MSAPRCFFAQPSPLGYWRVVGPPDARIYFDFLGPLAADHLASDLNTFNWPFGEKAA